MDLHDATAAQHARLHEFVDLVRASPHNLVSRRASAELTSRHVPESAALARLLPAGPGRLLDVGSGGGFPGMVIAILRPDLEVHLLDATRKKAAFLESAVRTLDVSVTIHHGRAEELARGPMGGTFHLVTARAVAPLVDLLGYTLPFLRPDGALYAVKGERWAEELRDAESELRRHGGVVLATPDDLAAARAPGEEGAAHPRVVIIGRAQ
jgi:16S rRNA (guanine527-N7)-methyltransferase